MSALLPALFILSVEVPPFVAERAKQQPSQFNFTARFGEIDLNFDSVFEPKPEDDAPSQRQVSREAKADEPARVGHEEADEGTYQGMHFFYNSCYAIGLKFDNLCRLYFRDELSESRVKHYQKRGRQNAKEGTDRIASGDAGGS